MTARSITHALDAVLADDPDRVAVVGPGGSLSYGELDAAANAAAALLADLGVRAGDRVAATLPNDVDVVVAFHGVTRLGAVWVGVNRALAAPEKEALLALARPAAVLVEPGVPAPGPRTLEVGPSWLRGYAGADRPPAPSPEAPAGIAFTSGTTGRPRGVVHSHRNLMLPAEVLATRYGPDLRKGDCLPLTILNLMVLTTLLTAAAGGCSVLTDRRDVPGLVDWLADQRVSVWNGVPTQLYGMVHDPDLDPGRLGALTEVWSGGADCPQELLTAFRERFGVPVCATYGLTEAPSVVAIDPRGSHVAGASGRPLPHLDVRVAGDGGTALPPGEVGEITVRTAAGGPWAGAYTPALGEWTGDGLVAGAAELRTGDLGFLDGDGWLHVRGRTKLLIVRGGANVYPAEVERVLAAAPGVREAVVLGLPDDRLGQRVVAVVERAGPTSEAELVAYCRERLARYKVPERIVLVDALARNAMGKPDRAPLPALFRS